MQNSSAVMGYPCGATNITNAFEGKELESVYVLFF